MPTVLAFFLLASLETIPEFFADAYDCIIVIIKNMLMAARKIFLAKSRLPCRMAGRGADCQICAKFLLQTEHIKPQLILIKKMESLSYHLTM